MTSTPLPRSELPGPDGVGRARLLILVNEDWMFWSHRRSLARAARDAGADVVVVTRVGRHGDGIRADGLRLHDLRWRRGARDLSGEARAMMRLARIYRRERPDIVHHVGIKAALYGGLAARLAGIRRQVHTLAGFGYVQTGTHRRARWLRRVARWCFRHLLDGDRARLVVQNPDDQREIVDNGWFDPRRVVLIRGSGVDTSRFAPAPEPDGVFTVTLAGRLVRSKGVFELAEASRRLAARGVKLAVRLVGEPDPENPETVDEVTLRRWMSQGLVEWSGWVDDMPAVWRSTHVAVLPSYREGLPRTLLEAASCGRALVAADVPGCREIVRHEENGLLVPVRDPAALADAIERLAASPELRRQMGARSRERVERFYSDDVVISDTFATYRELLESGGRG
jgi:glycosyltransferase involved in cell wall biosynthesis